MALNLNHFFFFFGIDNMRVAYVEIWSNMQCDMLSAYNAFLVDCADIVPLSLWQRTSE